MADGGKTKVAILGGGCGGISAAYWLTSTEERRARFDVTVYTQGWRLGGKGASGRNAHHAERIEEHGLHLFLGFYEVAFETLRGAYAAQAGRPGLFPNREAAFRPQRDVTLWLEPAEDAATWQPFTFRFPKLPGEPGDPEPSLFPASAWRRLLRLIRTYLIPEIERLLGDAIDDVGLAPLVDRAERAADAHLGAEGADVALFVAEIESLFQRSGELRGSLIAAGAVGRLLLHLLELGLSMLRGYFWDVLPHGIDAFDRIDDHDFSRWLEGHGASDEAAWSAPVRAVYDLAFAYRNGDSVDRDNAAIAAGAALRLCWRMILDYRDAPLWRMNAGMGDTVFTPLFTLLRDRGVRFEFFHRVQQIGLSAAAAAIGSIEVSRQVDVKNGPYRPLRRVIDLDCWPSEPLWDQIVDGDELARRGVDFESPWTTVEVGRRTLQRGQDFDCVVLAIPPSAATYLTRDLAQASDEWRRMLENSAGVPTHSAQFWLKPDIAGLDWKGELIVSSTYVHPLESWADMSHLLSRETHGPDGPRSCQYLCGTVVAPPDVPPPGQDAPGFQAGVDAAGQNLTRSWTAQWAGRLWPSAASGAGLDWALVVETYDHVNIAPSELYVQTLPGSVRFRLRPGWGGFGNLALAGDWTVSTINGGSAEAAFESGKAAAEAIVVRAGEPA